MPPGKKAASKTPMADYDDGCRVTSISTSSPITTSRRSSSPLISRPANASASRHHSRPSTPNLEKTSKSASLDPVALHPGIHGRHPDERRIRRFYRDGHQDAPAGTCSVAIENETRYGEISAILVD